MVPFSVGTQTVASVNRPAAYCGIAAFKPSTRCLSNFGIAPLGPSYDTPGFFGWSVADAVYAYKAVAPAFGVAEDPAQRMHSIVFLEDPHLQDATPETLAAVGRLRERLAASGLNVENRPSPIDFKRLFEIQRMTMLYEASRAMHNFTALAPGQIGEKLQAAIAEGNEISESAYLDRRREIDLTR